MTFFHVWYLVLIGAGAFYGAIAGHRLFGLPGAIAFGIAGAMAGWIGGRITFVVALRLAISKVRERTTEQLRADLRDPACLAPNLALLALKSRNAVRRDDVVAIVEQLATPSRHARAFFALNSVYPALLAGTSLPTRDAGRAAAARDQILAALPHHFAG